MRYRGQGHELSVTLPPGPYDAEQRVRFVDLFDIAYEASYARRIPDLDVEVINWTLRLVAAEDPPEPAPPPPPDRDAAPAAEREVFDVSGAGRHDVTRYYQAGVRLREEEDRDGDGRAEIVTHFIAGFPAQREADTTSLSSCHLLFVGPVGTAELAHIVQLTGGTSVLTVGEMDWFVDAGGMIRLFVEGGKVRFEVNAGAAERAQLKVSSQLLKLARSVRR